MSEPVRSMPGWVLPVGLVALVVALVAVALLRGPIELDPDTPEGTVQQYLLAVHDQRWDEAVEIIEEGWRGSCDGSDLRAFAPDEFSAGLGFENGMGWSGRGEVAISDFGDETPVEELPQGTTQVEVTIHHNDTGPMGGRWNEGAVFQLIEDDGFWWLTNDPWPYFIWSCRES